MSQFEVNTSDLLALAAVFQSLISELSAAGGSPPDFGGVENGMLEDRLHHFYSDWTEGFEKVGDDLKKVGERLNAAGNNYQGADHAIGAAFGGQ
jgi:hypothetical protein